ncbi:hypothetical protein P691DRAFT_267356 [Macrolepiota fuliginosa MF-IS2]|uniref:Uncharacterized protein n=1 Tax=Macrolepiota fuliginosa MF-IS2 TaxID=1400762 RepID=A0A9P6C561_9AGAR|nr:hypothetical protein P691DRAFT_267356 [Macrolepiota fuliginosa MF-IS2]
MRLTLAKGRRDGTGVAETRQSRIGLSQYSSLIRLMNAIGLPFVVIIVPESLAVVPSG